MTDRTLSVLLMLAVVTANTAAFNHVHRSNAFAIRQQSISKFGPLYMSSEEDPSPAEGSSMSAPSDGTVYDDEVEPSVTQLSDSMRSRLMAEASSGLDSDKKQTNVLLYIIAGVAALVVLGGGGIFY